MSLWNVDFDELYRRHLCRHSQFGINVQHLASVVVTYVALYGLLGLVVPNPWWLAVATVPYVALLAFHLPVRLLVVNVAAIAAIIALSVEMPPLPVWAFAVAILVAHRSQVWSHRVYKDHHDMSEFADKYRKGPRLFVLLSLYELPILLNYLVFDRARWAADAGSSPAAAGASASGDASQA